MDYAQLVKQIGKFEADKVLMDIVQKNAPAFRDQPLQDNIENQDIRGMREYDNTYGSASNRSISLREDIGNKSGAALQSMGMDPRTAQRQGRQVGVASEFLPVSGDLVGADEASRAFGRAGDEYSKGNLLNAGIQGTLGGVESLLSVIGMAGITKVPVNIAKNAARKVAKSAMEKVARTGDNGGPPLNSIITRSGADVKAAQGIDVPINRGDLSPNVYPTPLQEMSAKYRDRQDLIPRRIITPEDLEGQASVKAYGDRTDAGLDLLEINGQELSEAVELFGGADYMRGLAQQIDGSAWASAEGKITLLVGEINRLKDAGYDTNLMYTAMSGMSDKFSNMVSEAVVNQIPYSKILKKDAKLFDKEMQNIINVHNSKLKSDAIAIPKWVGIQSPDVKRYLNEGGGTALRVPFISTIGKNEYFKKGFPDIGSTRFAVTSPDLIHANALDSGYMISSTTGRPLKDMKFQHPSYPTGLEGVARGGFEVPLPAHIAWPDWMKSRFPEQSAAGMLDQIKLGSPDLRSFDYSAVSQKHTPQWVDEAMAYTERQKALGY
tara:strand:- start:11417 stop:13066 length:1650 start_codon:yes stop_codon:yes gene_type:complete